MGIPIEEIIKSFDYIKHVGNGESTYEHCREEIALDEAVTIMQKYQKIEQIIDEWLNQSDPRIKFAKCLDTVKKIAKVVKDINDDN